MSSAIGMMGVKPIPEAKGNKALAKATVDYIAKIAAAVGEITQDEQLLAIGDGLGKVLPNMSANRADLIPPAPAA